jgi:hypothetical protein
MRPHPLGVLPEGNRYLVSSSDASRSDDARRRGLGALATLPDALVLRCLGGDCDDGESHGVGGEALAAFARCSRACRAFAAHEDLWKQCVLRKHGGDFAFAGRSWRETYAAAAGGVVVGSSRDDDDDDDDDDAAAASDAEVARAAPSSARADRPPLFSDALYFRHVSARFPIDERWISRDTIPRRARGALSPEAFARDFEARNAPVIIAGLCADWPAVRDARWSREAMSSDKRWADAKFTVGGYEMRLRDFWRYVDGSRDDLPMYLFDKRFAEKAPGLAKDYAPPPHFSDDLFALLGEDGRPDYRWLIAGGARSGSGFHVDPNGTSAWNAVVSGRKKWIMFNPDVLPPGVHPSEDGTTVTQPVTIIEWYMNFYDHVYEDEGDGESEDSDDDSEDDDDDDQKETAKKRRKVSSPPSSRKNSYHGKVFEGICDPGDVLFVPSGWWHCALNLEETVAVTQNFCSPRTLPRVLRFLDRAKARPVHWSPYDRVRVAHAVP